MEVSPELPLVYDEQKEFARLLNTLYMLKAIVWLYYSGRLIGIRPVVFSRVPQNHSLFLRLPPQNYNIWVQQTCYALFSHRT